MFRGMRKKFMMVLLASSGMYCDLIFIIDGQNNPQHASNVQKPKSCIHPAKDILPPLTDGVVPKNVVMIGRRRVKEDIRKTICM